MEAFCTKDIYLAASLLSLGHRLLGLKTEDVSGSVAPYKIFMFEETPELLECVSGFFSGQLRIEPGSLFASYRFVKSKAHNFRP